jgi:hypothetical protein
MFDPSNPEECLRFPKAKGKRVIRTEIFDAMSRADVNISGRRKGTALDLFNQARLKGWCWQMSSSLAALCDDNDSVMRGRFFSKNGYFNGFHHGWIEIERAQGEFVFDPAFSILCKKSQYYDGFGPEVFNQVRAGEIKELLIDKWNDAELRQEEPKLGEGEWISVYGHGTPLFRGEYKFQLGMKDDKIETLGIFTQHND